MEIYLSHMFVYRVFDKLRLLHLTGNEILNYAIVCIATICGAMAIALVWSRLLNRIKFEKVRSIRK